MHSDVIRGHLIDIRYNIELAARFIDGLSRQQFEDDIQRVYAVTRCLEIISDASRRLPDALKHRHLNIAWRDIAGASNVYRHDYSMVSTGRIWETVDHHLPALRQVVEIELDRL